MTLRYVPIHLLHCCCLNVCGQYTYLHVSRLAWYTQGGLHKLVQQLTDLQKEHTALLERCENISEDLKHSEHEKEKLKDLLIVKDIATKVKVLLIMFLK